MNVDTIAPRATIEGWRVEPLVPLNEMLHFPVELSGVRTPFRERVLNYIYRTALGQSRGLLESAIVEAVSEPDDQESLYLNLSLTIDMNWDELDELCNHILDRISEWSRDEWSEQQRAEYSHWIYFSLTPSRV